VKTGDVPTRRAGLPVRLKDPEVERAVRELRQESDRLAALPAAGVRILADQALEDGVATPIAHGLGRPAAWACPSAPRDAVTSGRIVEVRSDEWDRDQYVVLQADGWGATITIDLAVL
jgi:hypothetical protein